MSSFDIVNEIDIQTLDNAVNVAKREILNRFDFRDSKSTVELDKKELVINIVTENDMRMEAIVDSIRMRMVKQRLDPACIDTGKEQYSSGNMIKKDLKIREGIDKDTGRKIIGDIKDSKLKVQAQLMDDKVRVTGKKIDDLQMVIRLMRQNKYELPLQFVNMK